MTILRQCCCGCSLEQGSKIIAILCIIGRCASILLNILAITALNAVLDLSICNDSSYFSTCINRDDWDELSSIVEVGRGLMIFDIVLCAILLVMDSLLLYGINTKRRGFMLPWIISESLGMLAGLISVIVLFQYRSKYINIYSSISSSIIGIVFGIYFLLVVISYYQQLGEPEPQPPSVYVHPASPVSVVTYPPGNNSAIMISQPAYPVLNGAMYPNQPPINQQYPNQQFMAPPPAYGENKGFQS